ncbi:MAG: ABC transporter permease [Bacteroidaceae bacterium]|nr:ABC transporter permease [Bacteroidaceae bacterium]
MSKLYQEICDICLVWRDEMKNFVQDEGILLFCLLLPFAYPLLYAWIYNNEVVREVPVVVVDDSHSAFSREFIQSVDASPDVRVAYRAGSLEEARRMVEQQKVRGIYYLPPELETNVLRGQPSHISVYTDMAITLYYKAIFQTATAVVGEMNKDIRISSMTALTTQRDEEISAAPLSFDEVPIFNPAQGYGSFVLPAVLILIIQQTLMLGIGLSEGTRHERHKFLPQGIRTGRTMGLHLALGKGMAYFMVYVVWTAYLTLVVPRWFSFVMIARPADLILFFFPYLLACISFGLMLSWLVRYRENVLLLVVFTSIPFLFLSGISWPQSAIPPFWRTVGSILPSTYAIRGFVRMASMGATLADVLAEFRALWIQAGIYLVFASFVMRRKGNPKKS